jgi:hypothetical protein
MLVVATLALAAASVWAGAAPAAGLFSDTDVKNPTLKVNGKGIALVTYQTQAGATRHVLVSGAVNAVPHPDAQNPSLKQQAFTFDYSGGWKSQKNAKYWQTLKDTCKPYDGPALPLLVVACKAADGSYWSLQSWQRNLPMRGFDPWTAKQKAFELWVAHWTGPLPELEIYRQWTYGGQQQGFFGRLLYQAQPVFGTRSPSASVQDPWARNITIDVLDSDYGPGWRHDTQINTHPVNGGFCYSFVPQVPPKGYPSDQPNGNGLGTRWRVLVSGPGVTPIITWEGDKLGPFDAAKAAETQKAFDSILGGDQHCSKER